MYSDAKYVKQREKLVDKALKETFDYCADIDDGENKDLFNRVFLNIMDRMCYEKGISHLKPRKMSHEILKEEDNRRMELVLSAMSNPNIVIQS
jgi:hypothetical protein